MRQLITPPMSPARELALDEALLVRADESSVRADETVGSAADQAGAAAEGSEGECVVERREGNPPADPEWLRLWTFDRPVLVLGRSSKVASEVSREACQSAGVPVLRRCSGGASIVGGPGCLMYSVVLSLERRPAVRKIDEAHRFVMGRLLAAVTRQLPGASWRGTCDLVWQGRKFSGNSLRVARRHLLYHGTILYRADLELIARCLAEAPRQPEYRRGRPHGEFVVNAPLDPVALRVDLADAFGVTDRVEGLTPGLAEAMKRLVAERYSRPEWHARH